jgi:CRP-like cAMP-binding protein
MLRHGDDRFAPSPLRGLSDADWLRRGIVTIRTFEKQAQILGEQEQTTDVFFILSGTVRPELHRGGARVIFNETEAGEIFGEFCRTACRAFVGRGMTGDTSPE